MTLITWHNGGPLFRDGTVGTAQDCCCDAAGCGCDEALYESCPEDYAVTFDVIVTHPDQSTEIGTANITITKDVDGFGNDIWYGFELEGGVSATLYCLDGVWILDCLACGFVGDDFWFAFLSVEVGSVCECPTTGTYTTVDNYDVVLA